MQKKLFENESMAPFATVYIQKVFPYQNYVWYIQPAIEDIPLHLHV